MHRSPPQPQPSKPKTANLRAVVPRELFIRAHHAALDLDVRLHVFVIDAVERYLADLDKDPAKARRAS